MNNIPEMDGFNNFDHYNNYNDMNDTGELQRQPPRLEDTAFSMIMVILFISFYSSLCGFCHRNDRNGDRNDNDNDNRNDINESLRNSLLTKIEGKKSSYEKDNENDICSICLENFVKKDKIITLDCEHYYHDDCITNWLKKDQSCPLCRENLL